MNLVIVESPAKARQIERYLGAGYQVMASFGHVRDLPPKDGSVRPDEQFAMSWQTNAGGEKRLRAIASAMRKSESLLLATDPDREGEAISWHLVEELRRRRVLVDKTVARVTFNEITKDAVRQAFKNPRMLDDQLIDAYRARRALDYLVGFELSPVLWRKLPGSRSAGRVQSVALRLICDREGEVETFVARDYWTIQAQLHTPEGEAFSAQLTSWKGEKLERFTITSQQQAEDIAQSLMAAKELEVMDLVAKTEQRHPVAPFTTSSLQQEASRKLNFSATQTMRVAQRLYEGDSDRVDGGLITYMRTDGTHMASTAIQAARHLVGERFGEKYLPNQPRHHKTRAKNAQEAHEGIRPTDFARTPEKMKGILNPESLALYTLVWKRAVASQMSSAIFDRVTAVIHAQEFPALLRAHGSQQRFAGFLALYQEDQDEPAENDQKKLPPLAKGQSVTATGVEPLHHQTQPPPRFSEASLVKKMEDIGIGRPSTYAAIIQVLQERTYVRLEKKRFFPEDRGRIVTAFLDEFFTRYVAYAFTADLETQLDEISAGRCDWQKTLLDFWEPFSKQVTSIKEQSNTDIITALDIKLERLLFADPEKERVCPACSQGRLGLKLGRNGGFVGCARYPDCTFTRSLQPSAAGETPARIRALGVDPQDKQDISLRLGPYGPYVQKGQAKDGAKPARVSLPPGHTPEDVTLEIALALLGLPRWIGSHPDGEDIIAGIGRFGPYLRHQGRYVNLKGEDDVLIIGLNRAVVLVDQAPQRSRAPAGQEIGRHPDDDEPILLFSGRYGPYIKHQGVSASISADSIPDIVTAVQLLADRALRKPAAKKAPKRATAKKPAKSAAAKKPAKSTAAKKPAKSAAAKSTTAKTATKKPATAKKAVKSAAAKKPVKSVAVKSAAAKSTTTKTATKKPATAKKPSKSAAAKKPAKSTAAKKPVKSVATKTAAKTKSTAIKSTAAKTAAKKAATAKKPPKRATAKSTAAKTATKKPASRAKPAARSK